MHFRHRQTDRQTDTDIVAKKQQQNSELARQADGRRTG